MSSTLFNFRSSGTKVSDRKFTKKISVNRNIGFSTPLSEGDDIFSMHVNPVKQLSDNFRNMLMTNNGERLFRYSFGANLKSLVFEFSTHENFIAILTEQIVETTTQLMPLIQINDIKVIAGDKNTKRDYNDFGVARITIRVSYTIPKLSSPMMAIEVDLNVGG